MTREQLSHTPYVVILYKYIKEWQKQFQKPTTALPKTFKEKNQLRQQITKAMEEIRNHMHKQNGVAEESGDFSLENFEEAIKMVNTVLSPSGCIPISTETILVDSQVEQLERMISEKKNLNNTDFWLLVRSLKVFLEQNQNRLPVRSRIPDMISDSNRYIELQNVYRNKARDDRDSLRDILKEICLLNGYSIEKISENTLKTFCSNCHCLRLVRTLPIFQELEIDQHEDRALHLQNMVNSRCIDGNPEIEDLLIFFIMLRSVSRFYTTYTRYPGSDQVESDVLTLKNNFNQILTEFGCSASFPSKDDYLHEMCRYGGSELHSVSAFVAGAAAHEAIKLITSQYKPLDNLFVYSAIDSASSQYKW